MKNLVLASLIACSFIGTQSALPGQEDTAPEVEVLQWQRDFENLDPATRQKLTEMLIRATALYNQKRIFEALNLLHEIEVIHADLPDLHNLKGACYVEFRDFARAREEFLRASELSNGKVDVLFNIAELAFVTHRWPAAEREFEEVRKLLPESRQDMIRLVDFKLFLIKMKLEKENEVQELAMKYDDSDDSPYYYFSQAALAYREDDTDTAERWIKTAQKIFRKPAVLTAWMDTLIEYGYVKSFYGGDLEATSVPDE